MKVAEQKPSENREKSKLARPLQQGWHDPGRSGGSHKQGVKIMSIAKFQSSAIALFGALIVAAVFVGAAVEPVVSLA
jgi:hypothetical protein